jgi:hypothetical protein
MKYIISEQRLERIVNKYLNTLDLTEEERYGNRLNLINHNMRGRLSPYPLFYFNDIY